MSSLLTNAKAWTHANLARKTVTYVVGMGVSTVAFLSLMGFLLTSMTDAVLPSSPSTGAQSVLSAADTSEAGDVVALGPRTGSDAQPKSVSRSTQEK